MPLRGGRMTPREIAFAKEYAATGDLTYASRRAGYGAPSGGANALQRPSIKEKIAAIREARLPELVTVALNAVAEIAQDRTAPASARVAAADKIFKVASQYRESQGVEIPVEEGDVIRILQAANRTFVDLLEHRPGEFGPAVMDEEPDDEPPEDEAAATGEREGIFG